VSDRPPARALRLPAWAWPLLALPVVAVVGLWAYRTIASELRRRVAAAMEVTLHTDAAGLDRWLSAQANLATVLVADPRVRDEITSLMALSRRTGGDAEALKAAPAQARLRAILAPVVTRQGSAGYFVMDPGGTIVARIVDERIGDRTVLAVADASARALAGKATFLPPTLKQRFASTPMAFMLVPVRDDAGKAIAVFAFRIDPAQMAAVVNPGELGHSGETYALDAEGRLLSPIRFNAEVAALLPAEANGAATAALVVRDPGARLGEGQPPATPANTWPLTWSAAEIAAGKSGVNVDGYRDFRGETVVGAWKWLPEWGIGLVSEIERGEAYGTLRVVRRAFAILSGALLLGALAMAVSSRQIYGLQKDVARAQRLGQYTLEEKIGEGGMGAVYRARHSFLRRPTAIKLIRSQVASADTLARFEREVQLTSALTHPNTIAVYDYGRTEDGIFYYAMEYLPGIPLDRLIKDDGPQPAARVVHLLKQLCASLAEAHKVGLVHRDVKPANMMLCERGGLYDVVKVLDFGLVKEVAGDDAGLTGAHHIVGTPLYMAPESINGSSTVDARSDVYAVGGVAYALIAGQPVFTGNSGVDIIGHHLHAIPRPPSEKLGAAVDPFLERLILSCLAKRPEDRAADAGALLAQIEEGWTGGAWTQAEARAWWETKGAPMLDARREKETAASRGPKLEIDVDSRIASARSQDISGATATRMGLGPKRDL
jgi:eukaryotic-like serine/threonine-protein kinase